jgi:heptosyltransferase I
LQLVADSVSVLVFGNAACVRLKTESLSSQDFSRILLVKPSALGDVVHTIPLLPKLRVRFPSAQIDWLITPENAELVRHHPALSGVVLFDRKKLAHFGRSWSATMEPVRLLREIRRGRYELVIDLQGQIHSALVTLATGTPVRIGFDRPVHRTRTESGHQKLVICLATAGLAHGKDLGSLIRIPNPT